MRIIHIFLISLLFPIPMAASRSDSVKVERLLQEAAVLPADSNRVLFFARSLSGTPYVANTLDEANDETVVVHLDKVDCMTFVETVLALHLAAKEEKRDFESFKQALQYIRYRGGKAEGYASRLHYFSDWIKDNERKGVVKERTAALPFSVAQTVSLDFMTTHTDSYPRLKNHPETIRQIADIEKAWQGVSLPFIPKDKLNASPEALGIRDGDVLAITTNIKGLDVVHTGFAVWIGTELHLLHASSIRKEVILDPQPLFDYSKDKKSHTGVRVISVR